MSGGVDSSVAALLLKEQGYDVIGAHMKLWDYVDVGGDIYRDGRCCTIDSITDCRMVCDSIDAPFYVLNMSARFKETVIDNFVNEYAAGHTPNPCVRCNSDLKWNSFLKKAAEIGCDYIATGHYARIETGIDGRLVLRKGVDATRDQSYVLWGVSQAALARTLMPLGAMLKSEVRDLARRHCLRTADKKESREICFVPDDNYRRFLGEWNEKRGIEAKPGEILHEDGRHMGSHQGTAMFTIGQRKGLGLTHPTPLYVKSIDPLTHTIIVSDNDSLYFGSLLASSVKWLASTPVVGNFRAEVKIRYLHQPVSAEVDCLTENRVSVIFSEKQRAITPGQSVVFYNGDQLLGGGIIESSAP